MGKKKIGIKSTKKLDDFATVFEKTVKKVDELITILEYDEEYEDDIKKATNILHSKVNDLHNARNEKDLKKVLKTKKIIKSYNKPKSEGGWNPDAKS